MTIARRDIVRDGEEGVYHCICRCVRRAFLCGFDSYLKQDFEHRRQWIKDRLVLLSLHWGLDILGYSVMSNHLHVVVRTRPDLVESFSSEEVARRWLSVHPGKDPLTNEPKQVTEEDVQRLAADSERIQVLRVRLGSVSQFMGHLNEHIARKANKEDACTGRFWEGRFKCQRLLDEGALLTCMIYVDLNPIRAKMAPTPEQSQYTGACDRIKAQEAQRILHRMQLGRIQVQRHQKITIEALQEEITRHDWLCPMTENSGRRGVFQNLTLDEYLTVLAASVKQVQSQQLENWLGNVGPLLERLSVNAPDWMDTVCQYDGLFRRIVGCSSKVAAAARASGRKWFHGIRACQKAFISTASLTP